MNSQNKQPTTETEMTGTNDVQNGRAVAVDSGGDDDKLSAVCGLQILSHAATAIATNEASTVQLGGAAFAAEVSQNDVSNIHGFHDDDDQSDPRSARKKREISLSGEGNDGPMTKKRYSTDTEGTNQVADVEEGERKIVGVKADGSRRRCSHDGCTNYAKDEGVCIRHGAKLKACNKPTRKTCSRDGCTNYAQNGDVCIRHGAKVAPKKICTHDGCTNQAQRGGICFRHGAKRAPKASKKS